MEDQVEDPTERVLREAADNVTRNEIMQSERDEIEDDLAYFEKHIYPVFSKRGFSFKDAYVIAKMHDLDASLQELIDIMEDKE